ncbi:adenylate kinase [Candidatus Uhrbacteria bacterium CG_4_10_14_0_8_um_filter_58_22]|uniref:Adenylate kinase n=1 Tax=Candidatus Uhrbacteria bacterium CG_4_10_14_0_8_um_filter_58_22 TaxID=1975029 RepID=A0A2M7Q9I1_9BACT|nr:MAG: adenylate kinase [Parcubacteria group bacterium CG1_02_58_44]PIY62384.1 MAG: adenylate kinase [Candidatus Uhrbacteria bacterium CG_4_10_14_0_8_um_filter_58_22]
MRNIVMLGVQGSGKGTQAEMLAEKFSVSTVSTGRLFRSRIEEGTELGREIAPYVERGDLVPKDIVCRVVADWMDAPSARKGFILDGFPRNVAQAEALTEMLAENGRTLSDVVYIRLSDEEAMRRLSGRRVCANRDCETKFHVDLHPSKRDPNRCDRCGSELVHRSDDRSEAISRRLAIYGSETKPLVEYYRERGLLREVDGEQSIAEVFKSIMEKFRE